MMLSLFALLPLAADTLDVTAYGAKAGEPDSTAAFQRALDEAKRRGGATVYVPKGEYRVTNLQMYGDTTVRGDGPDSVIRRVPNTPWRMFVVNPGAGPGAATAPNEKNVAFRDLTLRDNAETEPMVQQYHLIYTNGVDNLSVERVRFIGFRGDGLYVGSGDAKTFIRPNRKVVVRDCLFDGVNKQNRNGISVIGGEDVLIERNEFTRVSTKSPGCIDFEPNKNPGYVIRNVTIQDNVMRDGGGNGIIFDIPYDHTKWGAPIQNISILRNRISDMKVRGILLNIWTEMLDATPAMNVRVEGNTVERCDIPFAVEGFRGVMVKNNTFRDCPQGLLIGYGPLGHGARDVTLEGNVIQNVGDNEGGAAGSAFVLSNVRNIRILDNQVSDVKRTLVLFRGARRGGAGKDVVIRGNRFNGRAQSATPFEVVKGYQLDTPTVRVGG